MIKYKYARGENNKLININSLNKENRYTSKFFCVGCGNELIARLGKLKVHHFAHKKAAECSEETYLHLLGKSLFYENYMYCIKKKEPFFVEIYQKKTCNHYEKELGQRCKFDKHKAKYDLTKYFDRVSLEKKEDAFIPDIMLSSKNGKDKIFVEIAVTHLSTEQKLNSEYRIIELEVECDQDFEPIKRKYLSITGSKVKFINFRTNRKVGSVCNGNCRKKFNLFTVNSEGRCLLKQKNLNQIKNQLKSKRKEIVKHEIIPHNRYNYPEIFKKGVATFAKENLKVKNCFICRYHAENNHYHSWCETSIGAPIFCKFLKIQCNSNKAVNCKYFRLERKYVDEMLEMIKEKEYIYKENYGFSDDVVV